MEKSIRCISKLGQDGIIETTAGAAQYISFDAATRTCQFKLLSDGSIITLSAAEVYLT